MTKRIVSFFLAALVILLPTSVQASGEAPYRGYVYDEWKEAVPAPNGYLAEYEWSGLNAGCGHFLSPSDLFFEKKSRLLYVVDSGNNRIVVLDEDLHFIREYQTFDAAGKTETLNNPQGIFVTKTGDLYICDQNNARVLKVNPSGQVLFDYPAPKADVIDQGFEELYKPSKIVVDRGGRLYIYSVGENKGLLSVDEQNEFISYFGSNRVEMTFKVALDLMWKRLLTREQRRQMAAFVPIEYSNVYIDDEDFIYAVVRYSETNREQIKKLNAMGVNILRVPEDNSYASARYGDLRTVWINDKAKASAFVDVHVDKNGFISVLDATYGKVFQYDQDSNPVFVFGTMGDQLGAFKNPVSLESIDDKILVLDEARGTITVFSLTQFGSVVHKAISLYNDGRYQEALEPWHQVIMRSSNYPLAYVGIGKAYYQTEQYQLAMQAFKMANDKKGYSEAFRGYTLFWVREHFTVLVLSILGLYVLIKLIGKRKQPLTLYRKRMGKRHKEECHHENS